MLGGEQAPYILSYGMGENQPEGGIPPRDSDAAEVLKEMQAEEAAAEPKAKKEEEKGGDEKPASDKKEAEAGKKSEDAPPPKDDDKSKDDQDGKVRTPRPVKTMAVWEHEVAVKKMRQEHETAMESLQSSLKKSADQKAPQDGRSDFEISPEDERVKKVAEKWEAKPEFIADLMNTIGSPKLPKDITDKLAILEKLQSKAQEDGDNAAYSSEFAKDVEPLIKAEYPNASPEHIKAIKERIQGVAFTEDYARTPLSVIYKGLDEFRGMVKPEKSTAEKGGGGERGGQEIDFDSMSEDEASKLDDDSFERFLAHKRKKK